MNQEKPIVLYNAPSKFDATSKAIFCTSRKFSLQEHVNAVKYKGHSINVGPKTKLILLHHGNISELDPDVTR